MIVCIDPGNKSAGVAIFDAETSQLARTANLTSTTRNPAEIARKLRAFVGPAPISTIVVERVTEYKRHAASVDSVIALAIVTGMMAGVLLPQTAGSVVWYTPPEWKGGTPKPKKGRPYIIATRARGMLSPYELTRVSAPRGDGAYDVWDAVSLGLYHTGRATRGLRHTRIQ